MGDASVPKSNRFGSDKPPPATAIANSDQASVSCLGARSRRSRCPSSMVTWNAACFTRRGVQGWTERSAATSVVDRFARGTISFPARSYSSIASAFRIAARTSYEPFGRSTRNEASPEDLNNLLEGVVFEGILGRNVFTRDPDRETTFRKLYTLLKEGGRISLAEILPAQSMKLSEVAGIDQLEKNLKKNLLAAEEQIYSNPANHLVNWNERDIVSACEAAGFQKNTCNKKIFQEKRLIKKEDILRWFEPSSDSAGYGRILKKLLNESDFSNITKFFLRNLADREVPWRSTVLFLTAMKQPR